MTRSDFSGHNLGRKGVGVGGQKGKPCGPVRGGRSVTLARKGSAEVRMREKDTSLRKQLPRADFSPS